MLLLNTRWLQAGWIFTLVLMLNVQFTYAQPNKTVNVIVWDEQQPRQQKVYKQFIGEHLAKELGKNEDFKVRSVHLDGPEHGLSDKVLNKGDVLIWWGHVRHDEISPEMGQKVVERIKSGQLSMITLHSAHWATPFVEAMKAKTRMRIDEQWTGTDQQVNVTYVDPPQRYTVPKRRDRKTPRTVVQKYPDGTTQVTAHLPFCVFPAWRADGKPSYVHVLQSEHPIVEGVPEQFTIPQTEMYDEPFHVPTPDEVIFEERWPDGEWFRSGAVWNIGKGKVFYFRPGHETFPVYKDDQVLQILENAARWLAQENKAL